MNTWVPSVVALIAALASAIIGIIGALRGTAAQTQSQANADNLGQIQNSLAQHAQQIHNLALNAPAPPNTTSEQLGRLSDQTFTLANTPPASATQPTVTTAALSSPQVSAPIPSLAPSTSQQDPEPGLALTYDEGVIQ